MTQQNHLAPSTASRLQELELLLPEFVHELYQPLSGIKNGLRLIESDGPDSVVHRSEWQLVLQQVARLERMLESFRHLMHPGEGEPRPFAVQPVLAEAVELMHHRLRHLGERFSRSQPSSTPAAWGAPDALLHALVNLLNNAADAVSQVGNTARIQLRLLWPSDSPYTLQVRLSDNGPGIAPSIRSRIFEPGFTTKASGKGTGLGLSIARRMLQRFGGDLLLVPQGAAYRAPWASTEFCIALVTANPR